MIIYLPCLQIEHILTEPILITLRMRLQCSIWRDDELIGIYTVIIHLLIYMYIVSHICNNYDPFLCIYCMIQVCFTP